jgi:N-dimethylarginine dimethylaminohydrolase
MCPADHFDVVDVKNPHMEGMAGTVDRDLARVQWGAVRSAFEHAGYRVETLSPTPGCEDMVFAANQTFPGLDAAGRRICLLSRMKHASRQREVPAYAAWFHAHGYELFDSVPDGCTFEGCGDALWHPGRRLIWAGHGHRTDLAAHRVLADAFGAKVLSLRLVDPRFYHLDTCLCPLDQRRALVFPPAFDEGARSALEAGFDELIEVGEDEALRGFGCNATALSCGTVVIDQRAAGTAARLGELGYRVVRVDTGEFLKSGGSVFCLKQFVY